MRLPWLRRAPLGNKERWVVLDVEASGLDAQRDRLLAIAAIGVRVDARQLRIALDDSFEVVLRQEVETTDKANILLHGIGVGAQRAGSGPSAALAAFERYAAGAPLVAFHAAFDRTLIERGFKAELGQRLRARWLDLADLVLAVHPSAPERSLDEWMARMDIHCAQRHQAVADTFATAELLQAVWPQVMRHARASDFDAVARLASQRRWLGG